MEPTMLTIKTAPWSPALAKVIPDFLDNSVLRVYQVLSSIKKSGICGRKIS